LPRALEFHEALETRGIAHEWNMLPGDHDGDYWARNAVTYLRFYDSAVNVGIFAGFETAREGHPV
jgi:enterochelin esterase-like enzyme